MIQPWTVSPAEAGFETIHTMTTTATKMLIIRDNNALASRAGTAAARVSRSDASGKLKQPGSPATFVLIPLLPSFTRMHDGQCRRLAYCSSYDDGAAEAYRQPSRVSGARQPRRLRK